MTNQVTGVLFREFVSSSNSGAVWRTYTSYVLKSTFTVVYYEKLDIFPTYVETLENE